jgi:DNA-binding transcriptional MocR family regulator
LKIEGVAAGLHLMVTLPAGLDEDALADAAALHSMRIYGVRPHRQTSGAPALLLGYGSSTEAQMEAGLALLATILKSRRSSSSKKTSRPRVWDPIERRLEERIARSAR